VPIVLSVLVVSGMPNPEYFSATEQVLLRPPEERAAASELANEIDRNIMGHRRDLALLLAEVNPFPPDVTFALHSKGTRRHIGHVRPGSHIIQMPEVPSDYDHLL